MSAHIMGSILFTNHFYFKMQDKTLLADISLEIHVKTPINTNYEHNGEIQF